MGVCTPNSHEGCGDTSLTRTLHITSVSIEAFKLPVQMSYQHLQHDCQPVLAVSGLHTLVSYTFYML